MKKILLLIGVLSLMACSTMKKNDIQDSKFILNYGNAFIKRTNISGYLVAYDKMAWLAFDTLMKYEKNKIKDNMGPEWFGYMLNDKMVFVFGKFSDNKYYPFKRYSVDVNNEIVQTGQYDSLIEYKYAKAINIVNNEAELEMQKQGHRFNSYVYTDSTSNLIKVMYLPSLGDNFEIIYGNQFEFTLDQNVERIENRVLSNEKLKYFMLSKDDEVMIYDKNEQIPEYSGRIS